MKNKKKKIWLPKFIKKFLMNIKLKKMLKQDKEANIINRMLFSGNRKQRRAALSLIRKNNK